MARHVTQLWALLVALFALAAVDAVPLRRTAGSGHSLLRRDASSERPQDYKITLKTLLLSTDPVLSNLPRTVMNANGHPFTALELIEEGVPVDPGATFLSSLTDQEGQPQYSSVVLVSANLGYPLSNGTWTSALSKENWQELHDYCAKFGVRLVSLSSTYAVDPGLYPAPGFESGMTGDAYLTFAQGDATEKLLGNIKMGAVFRVGQVNEFVATSYWWAPAYALDNATHITPFLYINPVEPIENPGCSNSSDADQATLPENCTVTHPNWLGGVIIEVDGREEMHFFINGNEFGHHGFVFGDLWMQWAQRGTWLGERRMFLDTQVDDVFLSTRVYNTTHDRPGVEGEPAYRSSTSDFAQLHQFILDVNKRMGPGSRYVTQLAFNGIGYFNNEYNQDDMNTNLKEFRDNFFWVSHTWSHLDLYCYNSNCEQFGRTRYNDSQWDINKNVWFGQYVLYDNVPPEVVDTWPTYSRHGLVTPRISGLNLSDSVQAMSINKINNTVGDNSRKDLTPPNVYHAFYSTGRDYQNKSVMVIPRVATRAYYDCSTAEQNSVEHASLYGPECYGYNRTGDVTYPYKCNATSFKYPRRLSYDEIMQIESFESVRYLLGWRHDPYMFHQANLRFFEHNGRNQSLLTIWVDHVLDYVSNYTSVPIMTHKMDDLLHIYLQRMERDDCGLVARLVYKNGKPVEYEVTSNGTCTAKLTRMVDGNGTDPWQISSAGNEEIYGLDRTRDVPVTGGETVILPLGTPEKESDIKIAPTLPYPLLTQDYLDKISSYNAGMSAARFEQWIVANMTEAEKSLKEELASDVEEAVSAHSVIAAVNCKDGGAEQEATEELIDRTDALYYYLAMPTKEAVKQKDWPKDIKDSWYKRMEETIADVSEQLRVAAKATVPDEYDETAKAIQEHGDQSIDRLENYGTFFFKERYGAFVELKNRFNKLPDCSDGSADPVDLDSVTVFADPVGGTAADGGP